ncbi:MAG: alpha/beta fold hydrolase [Haloplanus sp.]
MARRDRFVTVDGTELHYAAWGDPDAPPVVCVHGLSRVGRDFDPLARALSDRYRILCPDMPGRGWSEWADDPQATYGDAALVETLVGFCDALALETIRYVGTSMGGGLGMALAGGPLADRISHLVVNDISPDPASDADSEALERILTYVPNPPTVGTMGALEAHYRETYGGRFSPMTDEEWRRFTVTSARRTDAGGLAPAYDPRIVVDSEERAPDPWAVWETIDADVMILRGRDSRLLRPDAYERMLATQPDAETLVVECGHAPSLNVPAQLDPIRAFLAG